MMKQRETLNVPIGGVAIGGDKPVAIQAMTDTDTADINATVSQIQQLERAGAEIVRVTVNNESAARAVPKIVERLRVFGSQVPIVGDFHYNGHVLLSKYPDTAQALDKYRINPGNVGFGRKKDKQFAQIIEQAIIYDKPVRIGVNWGSLDQELVTQLMDENAQRNEPWPTQAVTRQALIISVLKSAEYAESLGMPSERIVLSCKVSDVQELIKVYQELAKRCRYPLHLGLTEAGMGLKGTIASSLGIGILLQQGIGDTIRVSLTPQPGQSRTQEVEICQNILQTLGLRSFKPMVTACPGCGRTTSSFFRELAQDIDQYIQQNMPRWREQYPGVEKLNVAVMGCVVNGPGESKHADIGISLPGTGENPSAPVFIDGEKRYTLKGGDIANQFKTLLGDYIDQRYGKNTVSI